MTEPIDRPEYWQQRLLQAQKAGELHQAIFRCPRERWERIEAKHREILQHLIQPHDSILDAGCGWGRLLTLLPENWLGIYLGVDLSPHFIHLALTVTVPNLLPKCGAFSVANLTDLSPLRNWPQFEWAVLISMRAMVIRNQGQEVWDQMERELRKHARRLLYLEYDPDDEGSVE